jgi:hypothetical protein
LARIDEKDHPAVFIVHMLSRIYFIGNKLNVAKNSGEGDDTHTFKKCYDIFVDMRRFLLEKLLISKHNSRRNKKYLDKDQK